MNTGDTHDPNNSGGFGGPPMPPPGGTPPSGPGYPGPGYPGQPPGAGFGGFAPAPPAPGPLGSQPGPMPSSFFTALFDYNFNSYVTPKVVKVLYILVTIFIGLGSLSFGVSGFMGDNPGVGIITLIVGALFFIVMLALIRITLEFYVAVIKISEDVKEIKRR
ncbi:uncharacterized protein DUF4282 [Rhodococcus sp. AG1013]|uniref:DUF4282 domain-containing protein n=1 Tax=Rhodococcus sp. AG1013 TaxID=2183996 RepID=UPI000E0B37EB|nr:DUF4282 domain-containing protein [Rhodococcus sp. AG1013]RDI28241.1 uncharacterized protein DUF4282 [Rhodococcus sp. AG1013]